ncbi:MAG TPA: hypothetical protein VMM14_00990 [Acidimicrobiia bacterium]|nr:hypothetical protein [Acidimicrobiia bacterium]
MSRVAIRNNFEHWPVEPFMPTEDFTGIRIQCRHGHDLRVSRDRLATLPVSGDGVLYLPGS